MARILVLGADGMVGHISRVYLSEIGHDVLSVARHESPDWTSLDVEVEGALLSYIEKAKPEIVVNCIGVLIKESEEDPKRAIRLNALLPRILEAKGPELGFRLIQLSSDCVFSGSNGPYREEDRPDADGVYGRTKALGEVHNDRDLTVRTSKVGPELKRDGSGLFNWFMMQKGPIRGFGKAMWGGVTTLGLAKFIDHYTRNPLSGLLHLTNGKPISKYDLLNLFSEIWGKRDVTIEQYDMRASDRSLICTRTDCTYPIPSYRQMLEELHEFMRKHREMYRQYE
jgi:dTDP-4-dehydrorhamnose reductase